MATGTGYTLQPDAPHTFADWIRTRTQAGGSKIALDVCGEQRSYEDIDLISDRVGAGMRTLDLLEGEHVSLMMANSIENIESWFGLVKAGLVEVPIHTANRGVALEYTIHHADSRAIVIDAECLDVLTAIADGLPNLEHVIVNGSLDAASGLPSRIAVHDLAGVRSDAAPPDLTQTQRDTCAILHSSGTTGPP